MVIPATLDFQTIHDEYRPRILRYLARLMGEYEAEDLTQEVFFKVSKALPSYRGDSQLRTWIYRIATNAAIDRLRQRSPWKEPVPLDAKYGFPEVDFEDCHAWTGEPTPTLDQQVFNNERLDCFYDFLSDLPETYRLVLALNQLGECTAREIAESLGLSVEVVKMRLYRGKAILFEALKAHCKPEDWL